MTRPSRQPFANMLCLHLCECPSLVTDPVCGNASVIAPSSPLSCGYIHAAAPLLCLLWQALTPPIPYTLNASIIQHAHATSSQHPPGLGGRREARHEILGMVYADNTEADNKQDVSFLGNEQRV